MTTLSVAEAEVAPGPQSPGHAGVPPTDPVAGKAAARQARLAASVAGLRRRGAGLDLERALLIAGSILLPTGLIVILLGWFGASHTSYDFEQTPYLISGGFLGAAMTIAGGFLYFGYWLTRLVTEGRRQRIELSELLIRLDNRMAILEAVATGTLPGAPTGTANGKPAPSRASPGAASTGAAAALVATATGTLVHRRDCSLVASRDGLRDVDPAEPGLKPCKVCQPFDSEDEGFAPTVPTARRG